MARTNKDGSWDMRYSKNRRLSKLCFWGIIIFLAIATIIKSL